MPASDRSHIFGPVQSGRLGASLGLDLLGAKICSFDCLYCEVGATVAKTCARKPYAPAEKILGELAGWLSLPHPAFDVVTLGGMGEPTLNSDLGAIIEGVHRMLPGVPVAVLTNSSLMLESSVRTELALADIVLPSMDTLVPAEFAQLNRPQAGISLVDIRRGLKSFRALYPGKIYLEVLLLSGVNDSQDNLERLRDFCAELLPDRVDVVTMTRPGAFAGARPATPAAMERFRKGLHDAPAGHPASGVGCPFSDVGSPAPDTGSPTPEIPEKARHFAAPLDNAPQEGLEALTTRVLDSLARRPQTAAGLARALGVSEETLTNLLNDLALRELIHPSHFSGETFYLRGAAERNPGRNPGRCPGRSPDR